jgi:hypothetical protein
VEKPQDASLLQVGANFEGTRQDHINIQEAVTTLRIFIEQHDPLNPSRDAPSTPVNENQEKKQRKKKSPKYGLKARNKR